VEDKQWARETLLEFLQFRLQLLMSFFKALDMGPRGSPFPLDITARFCRFFFSHCYYSFLQATELFWNPKLQVLLLKELTKCQQRYIS